MSNTE